MSVSALDSTLRYLRFNCIWPKKGQDLNPNISYYIKFIFMMLSTLFLVIGCVLHLIVSVQHNSKNITEDIVMIISGVGVYYFIICFVVHQKEIAKICALLSDFDKFQKHFDQDNKKLNFLSNVYQFCIDVAIVNCCLISQWTKRRCERENLHQEFQETCGLMVTTWMPFDMSYFPVKQLVFLWQVYSAYFSFKGAAVISFSIMEVMEHLILRINYFKRILAEAISTKDDYQRQKLFARCIEYHIDILNLGVKMDKNYTTCLFLHVLLSGALFGCIGYQLNVNFSATAVNILFGWFLSLYIVCVSGQHLIDESSSVGDAVFSTNWYDRDVRFQKNVTIIMVRAQRPIVIHAGPFSFLSHVIILTILKTAYSYLSLLSATG